jgi:DNA-binding winged helix-turn-helix (wHTH) protein
MTTSNDTEMILASALQFRYQDTHLQIGVADKLALLDSRPLPLTRKEYALLLLLAENAEEVVPREVLLMRVWGYGNEIRTRTLDVHICRLRKHLASYSAPYIETILGIGYRFRPCAKSVSDNLLCEVYDLRKWGRTAARPVSEHVDKTTADSKDAFSITSQPNSGRTL